jgi:hypothetical protein
MNEDEPKPAAKPAEVKPGDADKPS